MDSHPTPDEIILPMLAAAFAALTSRECEVLLRIVRSKHASEIALILGIHATTASTRVRNLPGKLAVESRHAATMEVVRGVICGRSQEGASAGIHISKPFLSFALHHTPMRPQRQAAIAA